jgi:curli biogenesis system outer membrane secretion channel CsgG
MASGCIYGFHGGGLPSDVKTMAILPFENQTPVAGLEEQLLEAMRKSVDSRLGVRDASEAKADAVVSGSITRYDADIPIGYSASQGGAPVTGTRRKLEMAVDVEIVDQKTGKTLFERKGLVGDGEYAERAESDGRNQAIQKIVGDMIEGAQSQW